MVRDESLILLHITGASIELWILIRGKNSYGQLGLGVPGSVDTPRLVKLFDDQNIVCSKVFLLNCLR